ncbi:peptidoglycan editing factor PgeF [Oceanobacillus sp. J11TS1]|uniref:peptidoglycan editing factor PgeF n=1 Tax=Oceanobacillus sp. J11TS1 TaxID=2807191 RepID=UPI001B20C845|nr:peptidoglycan editing factor PgeF [Oceanobacillus sp. J11TS1]GIO21887.1 laccase domain protein [Oceanobacillus sp. J11TS1]
MEPFKLKSKMRLHLSSWEEEIPGLVAGFTTRNGGVSEGAYQQLNMGLHVHDDTEKVLENRRILSRELHIPLQRWALGEQVHGTNIYQLSTTDAGKGSIAVDSSVQGVDGLLTNEAHHILAAAFFADCVPLFFVDPTTRLAAIAHAGWKGTVGSIAEKMVQKLVDAGASVKDLKVAVGPSISKGNYVVDHFVLSHLNNEQRQKFTEEVSPNQFLIDLKQLNVDILVQSGVFRHNIEVTNYCTSQDETLFFSHRRDKGKTGRMLGFIGFRETGDVMED